MKCGLLGRRLGHSYSPRIHSLLGDYPYTLMEREPEALEDFLRNGDFTGINVTAPYKKAVIPYLDSLSPIAARLGAVNTIIRRDGKLVGHNTDYFGFLTLLRASGLDVAGKKVLVLGTGGASNTAVAVLQEQGARVVTVSRSGPDNYANLYLHGDAAVIVNTTPVGTYPDTEEAPLSIDSFPLLEGVLDVIYNPACTKLLEQARQRGLVAANGLLMLVAQAKEASEWFTGSQISEAMISGIHRTLRGEMENIVLIGMPGCGKSTVGRLLAQRLGKTFADADEAVAELAGKTIPQIFAQESEHAFRALETRALEALGQQSGLVIATGGGCVTRPENEALLRRNGSIFWLHRDLDRLPTEGRPLSHTNSLAALYQAREPLYRRFADHSIDNNGSPDAAVEQILQRRAL